jgi:hypothetical protein
MESGPVGRPQSIDPRHDQPAQRERQVTGGFRDIAQELLEEQRVPAGALDALAPCRIGQARQMVGDRVASSVRSGPRSIVTSGARAGWLRNASYKRSFSGRDVSTKTNGWSTVIGVSRSSASTKLAGAQCKSSTNSSIGARDNSRCISNASASSRPRRRLASSEASITVRSEGVRGASASSCRKG